jgi:hypothetical protein
VVAVSRTPTAVAAIVSAACAIASTPGRLTACTIGTKNWQIWP